VTDVRRFFSGEPIETYTHWVFLTNDRAYKVKRPVRFPFLDYSTLERRRHLCEEEVRLNRRLAPEVYRRVAVLTADGRVDGDGEPVEYAVEMERLPQGRMLDRLLADDAVPPADVEHIADVLARFHREAERADRLGAPGHIRSVVVGNLEGSRPFLPGTWSAHLESVVARELDELDATFRRRVEEGRIRDGHGDLHARNVCLPADGRVVLYDCIEFNPDLRGGDVAAEVAFLTMDLRHRGHGDLARRFAARYRRTAEDPGLATVLPFYERHRACVRGFVEAERDAEGEAARSYFRQALVTGAEPAAILLCGLPGTGKSTIARALAAALDADVLRSDVVRKRLFGLDPLARAAAHQSEGIYGPEATRQTYAALEQQAAAWLAAGRPVVVDATFSRAEQRREFLDGLVRGAVLHVTCDESTVRTRLEARNRSGEDASDASDADWDVYVAARERFEAPADAAVVHDGAGPDAPTLDRVAEWIAGIA